MRLLLLVVLMMMLVMRMLVVVCMVVVMALDPNALALASSPLLFVVARATQPSSVFLVPGTQWLAAKCKVVILNDGGDHPCVAAEIDLAGGGVRSVEVWYEEVGLGRPVVR